MDAEPEPFAVRLRISCEDPDVTDEVAQELLQWEGVWEDPAGADSMDPGVWGFVVAQLVALANPIVTYLSFRAVTRRKPIELEAGARVTFTFKPDASEEDKAALVQLLAEYGQIQPGSPRETI